MEDSQAVYDRIIAREAKHDAKRLERPVVRIWDGNWKLIGYVQGEYSGKFTQKMNETGIGVLDLPSDNWIAQWIGDFKNRTAVVHVTVDKSGTRWAGRMEFFKFTGKVGERGRVTVQFKHDYEELKHIYVWANPFLPAEVQFPHAWSLFGPSKWALQLTLFVNILRREASLWMLPDDPGDLGSWFNLDQSDWWNVVKPFPFLDDNSNVTMVWSRFSTFHDAAKNTLADAQLTVECRRWLEGDPEPWPGANIRHGALVWDIVDKSGWTKETSFGGNLLTGLERERIRIESDGMTQHIDVIPDPNFPAEYFEPDFSGTMPEAPWVVFQAGQHSGVTTKEFTVYPATDVQVVVGGHSMPGVNEGIKATITAVGGWLGSFIGNQGAGAAVASLTESLYTDVFFAFQSWKDIQRAQDLGGNHYFETFPQGADRAYTLAALLALRAGLWSTRQRIGHSFEIQDGTNGYWIGEQGHGDFWLGDRIGVSDSEFTGNRIYVEQVTEVTFEWDVDTPPKWSFHVGYIEPEDPSAKLMEYVQNILGAAQAQGVV